MVVLPYLPPVRSSPPASWVGWLGKQARKQPTCVAGFRRCGCGCGWERERRRWEGRNRARDLRWGWKGMVLVGEFGTGGYSAESLGITLAPEGPGPSPPPPESGNGVVGSRRRRRQVGGGGRGPCARERRSTCGGGMDGMWLRFAAEGCGAGPPGAGRSGSWVFDWVLRWTRGEVARVVRKG
jgi:hypothetical protein